MARAVGIDLGTTHSLVAWVDARNRPRPVPVEEGRALLPSAVHYGPDGAVEVGAAALRRAAERPLDTVLSVKRLMGRAPADLDDAERALHRLDGGPALRLRVAGGARAVAPVEVSAEILRALKARAAEALGGPPGGCVVTVPAWFDDAQRQATRDAGRLAGLEVLRLLPEPTAAALAYGLEKRVQGTFAVYDLGGGTFDLSVLRLEAGVFEVRATAGDTRLGGDDMDRAVCSWLLSRAGLREEALPPGPRRAALGAARALRERLSAVPEAEAELELPDGTRRALRLDRGGLEALIAPVVERTVAPCRQALRDAGLAPADLDGVVLVGGATRTPLVRRRVRELFGREPLTDIDPDTVVALGAAVQADALDRGGRDDLLLLDVLPLSLGVEMLGGAVERILPRNSTLPAAAAQLFTTSADGQTGLVVHVVQGERELAADCRSLARFTLRGIPPMPAGLAQVELTYAVDADGILSVSARERNTGLEQRIQVKPTHGLSEEEIEAMLVEALEHADRDVEARLLAEWRVEGRRLAAALEGALAEDGRLLSPGEREELDLRLRGLAEACAGDDPLAIQAWASSLDEAAKGFAERRMDEHVARLVKGRRVEELEGEPRPAAGTPNPLSPVPAGERGSG